MGGTKAGGLKAAKTNKAKYGKGFYAMIGAKGGRACVDKGFALNPELASKAGRKGGQISKRGRAKQYHKASDVEDNPARQEEIRSHFNLYGWKSKKEREDGRK